MVNDVKFSDLVQAEITKKAGVNGFISTDELPHYGLTVEEKIAIEKAFSCSKKDAVAFVAAEKTKAEKAIEIIDKMVKEKIVKKSAAKKKTINWQKRRQKPRKKAAKPKKKIKKK